MFILGAALSDCIYPMAVRACVHVCVCVCVCDEDSDGIVQICMPTLAIFVVSIHDTYQNLMH